MNFKLFASAVVSTGLMFAACGGGEGGGDGSGVPSGTALKDISAAQAADLCEYFVSLQEQPERTVDCGGGTTLTVGINPGDVDAQVAECTAGVQTDVMDTCTATVGDAEDCFEALEAFSDAELCNEATPLPAACDFFNDPNCG